MRGLNNNSCLSMTIRYGVKEILIKMLLMHKVRFGKGDLGKLSILIGKDFYLMKKIWCG